MRDDPGEVYIKDDLDEVYKARVRGVCLGNNPNNPGGNNSRYMYIHTYIYMYKCMCLYISAYVCIYINIYIR
jgi:hypothetical protein